MGRQKFKSSLFVVRNFYSSLISRKSLRLIWILVTLGLVGSLGPLFFLFSLMSTSKTGRMINEEPSPAHVLDIVAGASALELSYPNIVPRILVEPDAVCGRSPSQSQLAVLGVEVETSAVLRRQFLRSMYQASTQGEAGLIFVIAVPEMELAATAPLKEVGVHGDILIIDSKEVYNVLPNKTKALVAWFHGRCRGRVEFLLKVDTDVVVNWAQVRTYLKGKMHVNYLWAGAPLRRSPVLRKESHKNHESDPLFKNLRLFPPYIAGPTYFLNHATAAAFLYNLELYFKNTNFRNEDAMVGMSLHPSNIQPETVSGIFPVWSLKVRQLCGELVREQGIAACPCDAAWMACHMGSRRKKQLMEGWKHVANCTLDPITAQKLFEHVTWKNFR